MEERDRIVCTGETYHSGNQIHSNVVVLVEYKVLIWHETFATDGEVVEVNSDSLSLSCQVKQRGCVTGDGTYIWEPPEHDCPLHQILEMRATTTMSSYLVDESTKVLFNVTGRTRILRCNVELIRTNYPRIYLIEQFDKIALPILSAGELDSRDYISYHEEVCEGNTQHTLDQLVCESHKQHSSDLPIHISGNIFSKESIDLIFTFACQNRTASIAELDRCYGLIPVKLKGISGLLLL